VHDLVCTWRKIDFLNLHFF